MTFRVGQKVVCIKRGNWTGIHVGPKFGDVLVIRGFDTHPQKGLLFEGICSGEYYIGSEERGYDQSRFRPIVERKTDISIFTKMLTDKRVCA